MTYALYNARGDRVFAGSPVASRSAHLEREIVRSAASRAIAGSLSSGFEQRAQALEVPHDDLPCIDVEKAFGLKTRQIS